MYLEWDNKYSVGVELMDSQHIKLIGMINDLHAGIKAKKSKEALGRVIADLADYTMTHFSEEEKLMLETGYPDYDNHIILHNDFVNQVREFKANYAAGKIVMTVTVMGFLFEWLMNHIYTVDKKYMEHFNSKGIS